MLIVGVEVRSTLVDHLRSVLPNEGCGLLGGSSRDDGVVIDLQLFVPCRNALRSPTRYSMEPADQLAAEQRIERAGLETVGVAHSHPTTPAWPSKTDLVLAPPNRWCHIIVSFAAGRDAPDLRSFDFGPPGPHRTARERAVIERAAER